MLFSFSDCLDGNVVPFEKVRPGLVVKSNNMPVTISSSQCYGRYMHNARNGLDYLVSFSDGTQQYIKQNDNTPWKFHCS